MLELAVEEGNEHGKENNQNSNNESVKSETLKDFHGDEKDVSKRGPVLSIDQSLRAITRVSQESSASARQESSLSRLDTIGR